MLPCLLQCPTQSLGMAVLHGAYRLPQAPKREECWFGHFPEATQELSPVSETTELFSQPGSPPALLTTMASSLCHKPQKSRPIPAPASHLPTGAGLTPVTTLLPTGSRQPVGNTLLLPARGYGAGQAPRPAGQKTPTLTMPAPPARAPGDEPRAQDGGSSQPAWGAMLQGG